MNNAVLVIDMVKGFLEPGHNLYCGSDARTVIPNIKDLLHREENAGSNILFVNDNHEPDDLEFKIFCIRKVTQIFFVWIFLFPSNSIRNI